MEQPAKKFYSLQDIVSTKTRAGLLPISSATLLRMVAEGKFPKPVVIGSRRRFWPVEVVDAYIANLQKEE